MRNLIKIALTGALAIAMASFTTDLSAQTARRSTGTSTSSTSTSTTTAKRSTSSSTTTPASTSSSQVTRSNKSTSTTSSTPATSTTTAKRATTTTPASTSSTQVNRNNKSTGTTSSTPATSTTTAKRATTTTPASTSSSQVNRTQKTGSTSTATTSRSGSTTNAKSTTTQSRTTTPATTGSSQVDRTKKSTTEGSSTTRQASSVVRSTGTTTAAPATKEEPQNAKDQAVTRSNVNVTSKGLVTSSAQQAPQGQPMNNYGQPGGYMRMDEGRNMLRIPPRERGFMTAPPAHFYSPDPHYFGYRVQSLPPRYSRTRLWGVDYYFYDNVYYRRYGNAYMICRPPFGVSVSITVRDRVFPSIRFSYYYSSYHILNVVDKNYKTIFKQNQQIAANNALLARQNAALALNTQRALSAYELANALGLVQSYAGINTDYFYEDGVFYVINKKGYYEVIVPPAGALVDVLPDDYQTIVFNGVEYYLLDDTVYRLTLYDGYPYLEVLGQMPVSMSNKYNLYY